jgi:hypothetical protein
MIEILENLNRLKNTRTGSSVIRYNKEKNEYTLVINSSLIKRITKAKGSAVDFIQVCPSNFYITEILKYDRQLPSIYMQRGLYFETHVLGSSAGGQQTYDLPRMRNGEKFAEHRRIDEQILRFSMLKEKWGLKINPIVDNKLLKNTQLLKNVIFEHPELKEKYPNLKIIMKMELDLISPASFEAFGVEYDYDMLIIDLKLTGNINNTFGDFAWANYEALDHCQAQIYSLFNDLPFAYLVFDHSKDLGYQWFPYNMDVDNPNEWVAEDAKEKKNIIIRRIIDTVDMLMKYELNNWWPLKIPTNCKSCPILKYCDVGKHSVML